MLSIDMLWGGLRSASTLPSCVKEHECLVGKHGVAISNDDVIVNGRASTSCPVTTIGQHLLLETDHHCWIGSVRRLLEGRTDGQTTSFMRSWVKLIAIYRS